jgi:hypothetical protein
MASRRGFPFRAFDPENGSAPLVSARFQKEAVPYQLVKNICRHLVDSIGKILNIGGSAILPFDRDVIPVPIVFFHDGEILPRHHQRD